MADFLKELAAVKAAGYVVVDTGGGRWAFNAPNGSCSGGHPDETTAWAKAVFHLKKVGGAERAGKPWAVFGKHVYRREVNGVLKTPDKWKVGEITRETATRIYTRQRIDYGDFQATASVVARFATEGEAQAFVASASAAVRAEAQAVADAEAATKAATEATRQARNALDLATAAFVKAALEG